MKKIFSLFLFTFISVFLIGQTYLDSLFTERANIFNQYKSHKDTITVNTWMNIFKLNKYLQQLVANDSLIFNELKTNKNDWNNELVIAQSKLENLINEKKDLNRRLSEVKSTQEMSGNNMKITFLVGSIATILLIVFLILYIVSAKKLKKNNQLLKEYHTNLYHAKAEVEQLQKDQIMMAGEINIKVKSFDEELKATHEKISLLSDEKIMLENQMVEVKKAYDREVERRILVEEKINKSAMAPVLNSEDKDSSQLKAQINTLTAQIDALNEEIENERELRRSIRNELGNLLNRFGKQHS